MKKYIIISIAIIGLLVAGCNKKESITTGSIYGTVTDFTTGEPVKNANVKLRQTGATTLTGSDGMYEFLNVPAGNYNLNVSKAEYNDLIDDYVIVVSGGDRVKRDVQIEKLPSALQIMNNDGNIITVLDFGGNEGIISKTFKIVNRGTTTLNFRIYKDVDWIESITPNEGTIPVNRDCPIILKIDREKLADGLNTTSIIITSEDGGVELLVKAKKGAYSDDVFELPAAHLMVQLEDLGCVNWSSAKTLCESSTVAGYNDWRLPTKDELMTLYNNREEIGGFVTEKYWSSSESGGYRFAVDFNNGGVSVQEQQNHYYVRAVRTITVVELPSANIMVQTQDIGNVNWISAELMCQSSTLANYTDWRLPTQAELMILYNNRDIIGGFHTSYASYYWSSDMNSNGDPVGVDFYDGSLFWNQSSANNYVRAVRTLNGNSQTKPTVTTSIPSNVTTNSATCGGNVTSDGGATVTARGVCWSTSQNPTISNSHTTDGTGTGSFTSNITSLAASTTYYVRAYATNSVGTSYGTQKSFTTTSGGGGGGSNTTPTVTTSTPSNISTNSATCGGNVTSDGGASVTARGVCWSTSQNPTISSSHTTDGTGTGSFTSNITGLTENTTYYVRAYATNSEGTAYGSQKNFTTIGGGSVTGDEFLETFENGIPSNWARIDADGDGYTFELGTEPEYSGHNGGNCAISASYINDIGALTPDNYLVTPQMQIVNGSKLRFYACAQDGDYPYEHFGVAVSLTSQSNASSFTTIAEWDMQAKRIEKGKVRGMNDQGSWYVYTIDLSSYAGNSVYIAIRHFNCTDQFYLDIDDIELFISK